MSCKKKSYTEEMPIRSELAWISLKSIFILHIISSVTKSRSTLEN